MGIEELEIGGIGGISLDVALVMSCDFVGFLYVLGGCRWFWW